MNNMRKKAMKKRLVAAVITAAFLTVVGLLSFVGCKQKDPKYDVAIKVVNNYGKEWVFEPGVDELYYEFEYTGEEMTFGIDEYYVYGAPHGGDRWLDCAGAAISCFTGSYWYRSPEGETSSPRIIKERGEYSIHYTTNNSSWNYRSIRLNITVK